MGRGARSRAGVHDMNDTFLLGLRRQPGASHAHQQRSVQQPIAIVVAHCRGRGRWSWPCVYGGPPTPIRPCRTSAPSAIGPPVLCLQLCRPGRPDHQMLHVPPCQEWAASGRGWVSQGHAVGCGQLAGPHRHLLGLQSQSDHACCQRGRGRGPRVLVRALVVQVCGDLGAQTRA